MHQLKYVKIAGKHVVWDERKTLLMLPQGGGGAGNMHGNNNISKTWIT